MLSITGDRTSLYAMGGVVPLSQLQPVILCGLASPTDSGESSITITVAGVSASSIIIASVQEPDTGTPNDVWLVSSVPTADTITFNLGAPTTDTSLVIAWYVVKL